MHKTIIALTLIISFSNSTFSQIESGKKTSKNAKVLQNTKSQNCDSLKTNYVFLSYSKGTSFRNLSIREKFVKNQDQLNSEVKIPSFNVDLALKSQITKNFFYNFGIGYQQFGEDFKFEGNDTSISYKTRYSNLILPFKIGIQGGKKLNYFAATGLQGQMLYEYKKTETIKIEDTETSVSTKKASNLSSFGLSSCSTIGLQYNLNFICFALAMEYIYQLNSMFQVQKGLKHNPYFYGVKFSVGFKI